MDTESKGKYMIDKKIILMGKIIQAKNELYILSLKIRDMERKLDDLHLQLAKLMEIDKKK